MMTTTTKPYSILKEYIHSPLLFITAILSFHSLLSSPPIHHCNAYTISTSRIRLSSFNNVVHLPSTRTSQQQQQQGLRSHSTLFGCIDCKKKGTIGSSGDNISTKVRQPFHHVSSSSTTRLYSSGNGDANDDDNNVLKDKSVMNTLDKATNETTTTNEPSSTPPTPPTKELKNASQSISFQLFKLFSYIIQFLGLYFTFGLILNILGYGYSFDFENGFQVDKMENIRNERQFQLEMQRMSSSSSSSQRERGVSTDGSNSGSGSTSTAGGSNLLMMERRNHDDNVQLEEQ